ncbi:substrate-binding domain-containing protein [Plebeiibacterium marinum]|uniref:Substrate-binding domain-containing protein n=1 Tax=Plebeiibacterium marinum TaxID=2992111 RepID=A0AAE3MDP1_9BACT|nr:substrate-binding domain-containing protein [Plebeiobacterium marinum]MCW3805112.1 substrate-binding domain-containing protein [Plebeiobacterium marinum]
MKKLILLIILSITALSTEVMATSFKVIVNTSNNTNSISQKELALVFLKKHKKWDNGIEITPIDQKANANVRETFSTEVFNKKVAAIRSYWQKAIFSGMTTAPIEKDSDKEVVDYVKNNKGAIGYVSDDANLSGVKVITIIE